MWRAVLRAECFTTDELFEQHKVAVKNAQLMLAYEICYAISLHVVAEE